MAVEMEAIIRTVEANIDHTAYRAGREAGRSMSVRPGVERGSAAGASRQIEQGN